MYQEILCNFDNLREAYRLAHQGKTNAADVIEFDKNKFYNLNKLLKKLQNKEWSSIFRYYRFIITEPKERVVDAMLFEGRIVQHVLCDKILRPYFEARLVKENCACRQNKGTDYAVNLVKQGIVKYLKTHPDGWVLKMDVKKYFPSIDRVVLKNMLAKFPDGEIVELLHFIVDNAPDENGMPIGNQTSQWFALYYLDTIDRIIKEKYQIRVYARYMDDLVIIDENKEKLKRLWTELSEVAQTKLKLQFNSKTQLSPLHKGVSFLGWRIIPTKSHGVYMKLENGKRKMRVDKINEIWWDDDTESRASRLRSVEANLDKGNTYLFQKRHGVK